MKLQTKILLAFGVVLTVSFVLVEVVGYYQSRQATLEKLRQDALEIRGILMATRRVYHKQFLASGLPVNDDTVGLLPAHSMSRISDAFGNWSNSGLSFRNVSDRPRNPSNLADSIELEAMQYFRAHPDEQERLVKFTNAQGEDYYHFSAPIWIEPYCLQCHGSVEDAPESIQRNYQEAYGYKVGELRGLLSIKLPGRWLQESVIGLRLREGWGHLVAFLLTMVIGGWLLRRWVVKPLHHLELATENFARGDFSHRIPDWGNDEVGNLGRAFNAMAEQRLVADEDIRLYQHMVSGSPDMMALVLPDYSYRMVNDAYALRFDRTPDEVIGLQVRDLLGDELFHQTVKPNLDRCFSGERVSFQVEAMFSGSLRYYDTLYAPHQDSRGDVQFAVISARDITQRRLSELALQRSESRLREAQSAAKIANWELDASSMTSTWSDEAFNILDIEPVADAGPGLLANYLHPDDKEAVLASLTRAATQGLEHHMEYRLIRPDGDERWVVCDGYPVFRNDELVSVRGVVQDITDRKRSELLLQESDALKKLILETVPDMIWLKDTAGVYLACNTVFERFFGAPESQIRGKTDYDFVDQELADFFRDKDQVAMAAGGPSRNEEWVTFADDGHRALLETTKTPLLSEAGDVIGILGIGHDITERVQATEEKERMQRELEQAHKMEALGQLTGGIAHDFNNILGIIMGYIDLTLKKYRGELPEDAARRLKIAHGAADRARALVAQMLAFSRSDPGQAQPLQLTPLVKENLRMLDSIIPSSIRIAFQAEEELPDVLMDPAKLQQLIINLCINAKDAMDGSGTIDVRFGWAKGLSSECCACHKPINGDWIALTVTDTGSGMNQETLEHLFEPFYTTKEVGKGTGLGMAVVHNVMRSHGGHILVDSEEGRGSTFQLLFPPVLKPDVTAGKLPLTSGKTEDGHGENVLVVDDEAELANYLGDLLSLHGYHVVIEYDSPNALSRLQDPDQAFDLLVTDQTMPTLKGMDLIRAARIARPGLAAVLCTGYSEGLKPEAVESEGVCFIFKPVEEERLLELIGQVLSS